MGRGAVQILARNDPYYVVTDPDHVLDRKHYPEVKFSDGMEEFGVPYALLDVLRIGLERYPWATKCGLGIEERFQPMNGPENADRDACPLGDPYRWDNLKLDDMYLRQATDTTFAMYRNSFVWTNEPFVANAIRTHIPYRFIHVIGNTTLDPTTTPVCASYLLDYEIYYYYCTMESGVGSTKFLRPMVNEFARRNNLPPMGENVPAP